MKILKKSALPRQPLHCQSNVLNVLTVSYVSMKNCQSLYIKTITYSTKKLEVISKCRYITNKCRHINKYILASYDSKD